VTANRLSWDEASQTLNVQLPDIEVGTPNLDEARAQYLREGLWITRDAQDELTRDNTRTAEREAVQQAANPVLMDLARQAARTAVRQNLAIPLEVAGFGEVTVNVRFDGVEAAP
jgi:non-ribosomal peptide synthetase component E (peptide arylation enzyme)